MEKTCLGWKPRVIPLPDFSWTSQISFILGVTVSISFAEFNVSTLYLFADQVFSRSYVMRLFVGGPWQVMSIYHTHTRGK